MNDIVPAAPRLRMPVDAGVDAAQWRVLTEAIFPNAKTAESIALALSYCKVRGLDIMKKPVNIVPMWNSALGREVETVWPSINEIEVTASRSKEWAGMDMPQWGPDVTETFKGRLKNRKGAFEDVEVELTYPDWCAVTVYRKVGGERCGFVEPVFWREAYGRIGKSDLPSNMWQKRPFGQLHKVAKAASLRAAFPEEGDSSAEEMAGQPIPADLLPPREPNTAAAWQPPADEGLGPEASRVINPPGDGADRELDEQSRGEEPPDHDPETGEVGPREIERGAQEPWREWCTRLLVFIRAETELNPVAAWLKANQKNISALSKDAPKLQIQLEAAVGRHRNAIVTQQEQEDQAGPPNEGRPE